MMYRRRNGMVVLKNERLQGIRKNALLTRKLGDDGQMKFGVVLHDWRSGRHGKYMKVKVFNTMIEAFDLYKQVRALG